MRLLVIFGRPVSFLKMDLERYLQPSTPFSDWFQPVTKMNSAIFKTLSDFTIEFGYL